MQRQNVVFNYLSYDIIFNLLVCMDMNTILRFSRTCAYLQKEINSLLDTKFFLQKYDNLITDHQLEGVKDFKNLLLIRQCLEKIIAVDFNHNEYLHKHFRFFKLKTYYQFGYLGKEFLLTEIKPFLLQDDAHGLFALISRFNKMIPYFMKDSFDEHQFFNSLANLEEQDHIRFIFGDSYFIGLLPMIMQARAINCFDFFIRSYLIFIRYFNDEIKNYPILNYEKIFKMILSTQDQYFLNHFIALSFKVCNFVQPFIYTLFKLAETKSELREEFMKHINNLDDKQKNILIEKCKGKGLTFSLEMLNDAKPEDDQPRFRPTV